jgi:hypothetical protein
MNKFSRVLLKFAQPMGENFFPSIFAITQNEFKTEVTRQIAGKRTKIQLLL